MIETLDAEPPVVGTPYSMLVVSVKGLGKFCFKKNSGGGVPMLVCGPVNGSDIHEPNIIITEKLISTNFIVVPISCYCCKIELNLVRVKRKIENGNLREMRHKKIHDAFFIFLLSDIVNVIMICRCNEP